MTIPSQYDIDKTLVSLAIEYVLLEFGTDVYDKVVRRLNLDNHTILDCFDHPEYFSKLLNDLFGASYTKIINSIEVWLGNSSSNQLVSDFLVTVKKP